MHADVHTCQAVHSKQRKTLLTTGVNYVQHDHISLATNKKKQNMNQTSQVILNNCICCFCTTLHTAVCGQGGYMFYDGGSIDGVSCRRRWPRLLLLP